MNTAVVTGSRSMLGRSLCALLRERGVEVIEAARHEDAAIRLNLADGVTGEVDGTADAIFHCAASLVADTPGGVRENQQVNATGSLAVAELAERLGCRVLINAGTLSSNPVFRPNSLSCIARTSAHLKWGLQHRVACRCS